MQTIRVLIADDHPLMLRSLRLVLEASGQVEVVAEATTGTQVLPLVESARPEVVLLDVQLPELDGFACLERIGAAFPDVSGDHGLCERPPANDPRGGEAGGERLRRQERGAGGVRRRDRVRGPGRRVRLDRALRLAADSDLTERELAVVEAVARGLSNKEIGKELWITEQTVKFHLGNIFRKLEVANRTEAARVVFDRGLGHTGGPGPGVGVERTPPATTRR